MIDFAFEPRAEDVLWSPDRRPENSDRPEHPEPTGADFSLSCFRADVRFVVHGVDLSLCTPGLPVVDFALMLECVRRELETRSDIAAHRPGEGRSIPADHHRSSWAARQRVAAGDGGSTAVRVRTRR